MPRRVALAVVAPAWLAGLIPPEWTSRYGQRGDDWRLPKAEQGRLERAIEVGRDGMVLLEAVYAPGTPAGLADLQGGGRCCARPGSSSSTSTVARCAGATSTVACRPAAK